MPKEFKMTPFVMPADDDESVEMQPLMFADESGPYTPSFGTFARCLEFITKGRDLRPDDMNRLIISPVQVQPGVYAPFCFRFPESPDREKVND